MFGRNFGKLFIKLQPICNCTGTGLEQRPGVQWPSSTGIGHPCPMGCMFDDRGRAPSLHEELKQSRGECPNSLREEEGERGPGPGEEHRETEPYCSSWVIASGCSSDRGTCKSLI